MTLVPESPPEASCMNRVVADSSDRIAWLRARSQGITATDVSKLSTMRSIETAAHSKLNGSGFSGNSWTDHGRAREPVIAEWVQRNYGILPSTQLFHAAQERIHLATPDGIAVRADGTVELAEIKTTNKAWKSIPLHYLRQVWWQQYVLGAERTLVVWEQHENFIPVNEEPEFRWVDRDDQQINQLIGRADVLLQLLRHKTALARVREDRRPAALYLPE
ncbi:hypothetical protein GCM10023166_15300 [Paeniglutamicibacter cryotolerans]|uniref:YqaJ viral recombinase domain-containing protein n=2 Tax=Paeniglutamicibacter cryotolerans TaxID=670079 RepID=A0A839QK60_9MICC|nr:hypothetical protein [Paeniglutamicibacter cryotolerans]